MQGLLPEEIAAIEARHAAATKGPWRDSGEDGFVLAGNEGFAIVAQTWSKREESFENAESNRTFIAHAWADVATLLAEVKRLREREELRALFE